MACSASSMTNVPHAARALRRVALPGVVAALLVGGAFVARGVVAPKAAPSTELAKAEGEGLECGATGCAHEARPAAKAPAPTLADLGGSSPRVLEFSSKSCPACERMASVVKAVEDALKSSGKWHSMVRYQIIAAADPAKRARKPADFDKAFPKFITSLEGLAESPEKVLRQKVEDGDS